jgi:two-component system, cell cycle sensor histidine kinase and response regulator CckA
MDKKLRILILEDVPVDAELMERELRKGGIKFSSKRVDTKETFLKELKEFEPDLILGDYKLPSFDGLSALGIVQENCPNVPFIFISGTIGEELAIETLKSGATDYVLKDRLSRLVPAVSRALREVEERTERKRAEKSLQDSEKRYREVVENATEIIYTVDESGNFTYANPAGLRVTGYSLGELRQLNYADLVLPEHRERVSQMYIEQFREKLPKTYVEFPFSGKGGEVIWFGQNATLVMEREKIVGFHIIARDITERKRAEEALVALLARQEALLTAVPDIIMEVDNNRVYKWANQAGLDFFGEDVIGKEAARYFEGEQDTYDVVQPLFEGNENVFYVESWQRRRDDQKRLLAWWCRVLKDDSGNVTGALSSAQDITERKKMEEALRKGEEKYRTILENIEEGYYEVDLAGNFTFINDSMCRIFGYPKGELMGMNDRQYADKENAKRLFQAFNEAYRTGEPHSGYDYEIIRKDGAKRYIEASILLQKDSSDKAIGFRGIIRDITERKRAEEALRESEEKYRTLVETSPDAITLMDLNLNIVMGNQPALNLYGYENLQEVIGQSAFDFIAPEDRPRAIEDTRKMLETGSIETREYKLLRKGGVPFPAEVRASLILNVEKRPLAFICVSRDITERKKAEETLKKSEERFKELYDDAPIGYFEYNTDGRITSVNRTELEMLGYSLEEMIGRPPWKFIVEEDIARQQILAKLAGTMPPVRGFERTYRQKGGGTFPAIVEDRLILDSGGKIKGIRATIQDITNLKRAEEEKVSLVDQLRQSQKMEAIGQLAGGVAHDFNNLLTVIKGYCQLSLAEMKESTPLRDTLEVINKAAEKAADLTRQLLAFSRRQIMEVRVLDINALLQNLDKMLRRIIGEDIELVTLLGKDVGRVKADPGQIEQVVMNLAVNAKDAMSKGGKLTIETANVELDQAYARTHVAVTPGPYVMIAVSDTGTGMPPEVTDRVFEPFFTTKGKGRGTGLGLSTVYGIVKQSNGNIWVYSEPGRGTTFKIFLPRVDEPAEKLKVQEIGEEFPRGSETILVVEDDKEVRNLAVRILKRQGYTVLDGSYGDEAFSVCRQHKGPIHLLLTDVVMPGMDGRALSESLSQLHPEMKVLYMSGYTDDAVVRHGVMVKGINYIQKPFTVNALAKKVREVLEQSRQNSESTLH